MNPTTVSSRDVAWVLLRLAAGAIVTWQGWSVLFGGLAGGVEGLASQMETMGVPYPGASAWLAASVGIVCGSQLVLGLFVRPASFLVLAVAAGAALLPATALGPAPILFAVLAAALLVGGSGPLSFDAAKRARKEKLSVSIFR